MTEDEALIEKMTDEQITAKKKWLFTESIRLEELKKNLEDERKLIEIQKRLLEKQQSKSMLLRKQLENQKLLFDKQWQLLEQETRRLVSEQDKFKRDQAMFRDKVYREARKSMNVTSNSKIFFTGVKNLAALKKRYKALIRIYHPDNMDGDHAIIQAINEEYEKLSRFYLGT